MLSGRYTNFNFCSMAGIAGVAESIIRAIQDLKTSMCIVHCYICATGGTCTFTGQDRCKLLRSNSDSVIRYQKNNV